MKINDDWEAERDNYGWHLKHWRDSINPKTKESSRTYRSSYHANLEQCMDYILDTEAGPVPEASAVKSAWDAVMVDLNKALGKRRNRRTAIVKEAV